MIDATQTMKPLADRPETHGLDASNPTTDYTSEDISLRLPDATSYSAILDQSMPPADLSTLTVTESFVFTNSTEVFGDVQSNSGNILDEESPITLRAAAGALVPRPTTPLAVSEEMPVDHKVQFKLTITEVC